MYQFSQYSIQQSGPKWWTKRSALPSTEATPLAWLKRHDIQCFRVPVVIKLIISVGLQWKSLRPIGHISLFKGGVDLDAKVSCQKAFILSNQLVAFLTMTDCSGLYQHLNCMCCCKHRPQQCMEGYELKIKSQFDMFLDGGEM